MKAILVLNEMPSSCIDCRFCIEIDEGTNACCEIMSDPDDSELCRMIDVDYPQDKPDWCQLNPMPEYRKSVLRQEEFGEGFDMGYNACIDEILGDKEQK